MQATKPARGLSAARRSALSAAAAMVLLAGPAEFAQSQPTFPAVEYATIGGKPILLDIYHPTDGGSPPYPVVVWIHGGAWLGGSRADVGGLALLQHGVAIASIDYRLTSQAGQWGGEPVIFPAQIHDVKAAVRFLRAPENATAYSLDPCRVGAWGSSAGGHLAALVAAANDLPKLEGRVGDHLAQTSRIVAAADYFGPSDLMFINEDVAWPPGSVIDHDAPDSPESRLIGWDQPGQGIGDIKAHLDDPTPPYPSLVHRVWDASPLRNVTPPDPPLFIAHGDQDTLVPVKQSIRLAAECQEAGVTHELMVVAGASHGFLGSEATAAAVAFLLTHLVEPECRCTYDLDGDGAVSANDLTMFVPCLHGPNVPLEPECLDTDFDWDRDCDLGDFAALQRAVGGNGC